ncbi:hypothetical protein [Mycobacterium sp. RTGN5]|uniref:hypothetical protein n=1 Tax=Mycobacterium sp. RTGN5 TaxID=3016522 RepID=UPI0029C9A888|nr:hypothetical protein [Mycobacterium sp. RTGN5]
MAVATGVSTAAIGVAPAANASCASFFGLGNTANCHSTFGSIAIAIGSTAAAQADGLFGVAFASGTNAGAVALGILGAAISVGTNAQTGSGSGTEPIQLGNVAIDFGNHSGAQNAVAASGLGNLAVNLGGTDVFVFASGALNNATNVSGTGSNVGSAGVLTWSFNVLGSNNFVSAGPGFLAVAGSVAQRGATLAQAPFGININGAALPPSAAARQAALRNHRASIAPKSVSAASAKASKRGTAHSVRG